MASPNMENRIRPAILQVFDGDGAYRCERDLHHHLTILFNAISPLSVGQESSVIEYEHPTKAKYSWSGEGSKSGNVDMFFFPSTEEEDFATPQGGLGVEVNVNYPDTTKIKQDCTKLIDPVNSFGESVYVAFGNTFRFRDSVLTGLTQALHEFVQTDPAFRWSTELHIFVFEDFGGQRSLCEISGKGHNTVGEFHHQELATRNLLGTLTPPTDPSAILSRDAARKLVQQEMQRAGIPLTSTTARCMFEATTTRDGRSQCQFGRTPLWEHEVKKAGESVTVAELMKWIERLRASGQKRQGR